MPNYTYRDDNVTIDMKGNLEPKFAHALELRRIEGKIVSWHYEPVKLDLAPNLEFIGRTSTTVKKHGEPRYYYRPDFVVEVEYPVTVGTVTYDENDNVIEGSLKWKQTYKIIYEVKGWSPGRERGIAKFEAAANLYIKDYRFILVEWDSKNKRWKFKEYK